MKALSNQLKLINPKLYLKRKRALEKQLKENKKDRREAMQYEDYGWMEMFR